MDVLNSMETVGREYEPSTWGSKIDLDPALFEETSWITYKNHFYSKQTVRKRVQKRVSALVVGGCAILQEKRSKKRISDY